jgi:hypothetical protein
LCVWGGGGAKRAARGALWGQEWGAYLKGNGGAGPLVQKLDGRDGATRVGASSRPDEWGGVGWAAGLDWIRVQYERAGGGRF